MGRRRHRSLFGDHPDPLTRRCVSGRSRQRCLQPLKSKSRGASDPTGAAAAGAGGSGGGRSSSSSGSSRSRRSTPPSGRVGTPPSGRSGTPPVPVGASTPRGRPRQGQKEPRGRGRGRGGGRPPRPNPSPTLPWTPPRGSTQGSPQAPLNQADLQRRLRMLLQDQQQIAAGRRIANITTTNSIVTSYKEGGRPSVQSNSSRYSF